MGLRVQASGAVLPLQGSTGREVRAQKEDDVSTCRDEGEDGDEGEENNRMGFRAGNGIVCEIGRAHV